VRVFENVAFGLRCRRLDKSELSMRVNQALALVLNPSLLLLDEPLSALDAKVRMELRGVIRRLHDALGLTTILVTHDQDEALSMSDRIAVMHKGVITQCAPPRQLYDRPDNLFTARFIGAMNLVSAPSLPGLCPSAAQRTLAIRAEHIELLSEAAPGSLRARLVEREFRGSHYRLYAELDNAVSLVIDSPVDIVDRLAVQQGRELYLRIAPEKVVTFDEEPA
jgi:iron(III) transport system ATP-binding protein